MPNPGGAVDQFRRIQARLVCLPTLAIGRVVSVAGNQINELGKPLVLQVYEDLFIPLTHLNTLSIFPNVFVGYVSIQICFHTNHTKPTYLLFYQTILVILNKPTILFIILVVIFFPYLSTLVMRKPLTIFFSIYIVYFIFYLSIPVIPNPLTIFFPSL